jgi:chaperonin GroES
MSKQLFEPMSDKLICRPVEQEEMSEGGIILPDMENQKCLKAEVMYAGKGFWAGVDLFINTTLKPGDIIMYQRFSAQTIEIDNVEYQVVQERDVITKVNQ